MQPPGATHVLDYTKETDLHKKVQDICEGFGVSVALDTVGDGQVAPPRHFETPFFYFGAGSAVWQECEA
jgi:Zn-dependent alcohol dehydrogenase